jgi:hypothetical protein
MTKGNNQPANPSKFKEIKEDIESLVSEERVNDSDEDDDDISNRSGE